MASTTVSWETCEKLLEALKKYIGKPCPGNRVLANDIGVVDPNRVSAAIGRLVDEGLLERGGSLRRRQLILVETGEATLQCLVPKNHSKEAPVGAASDMPQHVVYQDIEVDPDSSTAWPAHWPSKPVARRAGI